MAAFALRSGRAVEESLAIGVLARPAASHFAEHEPVPPTLHFEDLLPDACGEIVLHNDSRLRALSLESRIAVVGHGDAPAHITLSGDNVAGFRLLRLANGVTVYHPRDLIVSVTTPASD